jgi:hypothetical protein
MIGNIPAVLGAKICWSLVSSRLGPSNGSLLSRPKSKQRTVGSRPMMFHSEPCEALCREGFTLCATGRSETSSSGSFRPERACVVSRNSSNAVGTIPGIEIGHTTNKQPEIFPVVLPGTSSTISRRCEFALWYQMDEMLGWKELSHKKAASMQPVFPLALTYLEVSVTKPRTLPAKEFVLQV